MKKLDSVLPLLFLTIFVLGAYPCFAKDLQEVCAEQENKFVFRLVNENSAISTQAHICTIVDFQENGDDCDNAPIPNGLTPIDINGDQFFDIVVYYTSTPWIGSYPIGLFVNCGDNTYISVTSFHSLFEFAFIWVATPAKDHKWATLHAIRYYPRIEDKNGEQEYVEDEQDFVLEFNKKHFRYEIVKEGNILKNNGTYDFPPEPGPVISFDEAQIVSSRFPALPILASFDCNKATTNIEKIICASDELKRLDLHLAYNFRAKKNGIEADGKDWFQNIQNDQREWLKKRNACKTHDCIKNLYIERIAELCGKYPSGNNETCYPYYPPDR